MKKAVVIVLAILIVLSGASAAVYYFFFMPNNNMVAAFDENALHLIVEGEMVVSKEQPKIKDDAILLPFDIVKKYFDPNIFWDDNLKKVTVTTKDRVIRMKTDSLNALINNKPITLKIPVIEEDKVTYIPIEFLSDFYNIEIHFLKDKNVIMIDYKNSIRQLAEPVSQDAVIRKGRTIHFPILKKFDLGATQAEDHTLRIFEEYDKWYKVRTGEGIIGYIEKRFVMVKRMMVNQVPEEEPVNTAWKPQKGKINLVWDMIYGKNPEVSKIDKMDGLDIVSPTWFHLIDTKGTVSNGADPRYVSWAHKNGYKVWVLFNNDVGIDGTSKVLNNTDLRDNVIRQVLALAALYKVDGINIDFENVYKKDKDVLTQFVRELTPYLKEQGLMVSIDVTVPDGSDNWSLCYDRKALGQVVDYVMLMTYDQHWSTSPEAGSVAQISWVEKNIQKVIELVPREKLLLGLPFYTRLWKEDVYTNGSKKVSSPKALSMSGAEKLLKENNAVTRWDEESGQFYAEYAKDGSTYKIWLEDDNSINLKSALVQKYQLAGAAAWSRTNEKPSIWNILSDNLKAIDNYQEWLARNKNNSFVYNG